MVHEQAAAFALDALDPDETAEFERHLVTCPACEDALQPLRFVAAALAFAGDLPAPRPELRVRVLDVGAVVIPLHRRRRGQLLSAGAVAAACLALLAVLQPWSGTGASATVIVGSSHAAVLVVRHLRSLPAGKAYEAWVVDRGRIVPAGLLHGSMTPLTRPVPAGAAVLVSVEPARGSLRPTGPVVLKAETA